MLCHLPVPYPDELLYSDIARYIVHISPCTVSVATEHIFGRRIRPHIDLPCSLNTLAERTWPIWQMSGEDIADRLTLFPYYSRFVPSDRVNRCLKGLLSDDGQGVHACLGVNASRVKIPLYLRFCKTCRESDIDEYGETYWHRSHQLAGVLVCPQHGDPLINTNISMRPTIHSLYADATRNTSNSTTDDDCKLRDQDMQTAAKIAIRCQEMLLGQVSQWDAQDIHFKYRQSALERGFYKGVSFFLPTELKRAFLSFFGHDLLSRMGSDVDVNRHDWIDDIFNKPRRLFHPVLHAMIQIFLETIPNIPSNTSFGSGPWRCLNPYAKHDEPFPIKKIELIKRRNGQIVASARCSCG
ncbi:MAG: TnsD family Tn7-like transposition protein, partial [Dissulfurispiraceae bacterium]